MKVRRIVIMLASCIHNGEWRRKRTLSTRRRLDANILLNNSNIQNILNDPIFFLTLEGRGAVVIDLKIENREKKILVNIRCKTRGNYVNFFNESIKKKIKAKLF